MRKLPKLALLLAWFFFGPGAMGMTHAQLGACIPDAEMPTIDGAKAHLFSNAVADVVILFRPGQEFSRKTLKGMGALQRELQGRSIHWVAVVSDRAPRADVLAEMKLTGLDMPVLIDEGDVFYGSLGVVQLPVTIICDQQHRLVAYQPFTKVNYSNVIRARLLYLLKEIDKKQMQSALNPPAATTDSEEAAAARRLKLAAILYQIKSYDKALENVDAGIARSPSATAYVLRGQILAAQGKCSEAAESFREALKLDPNNKIADQGTRSCQ